MTARKKKTASKSKGLVKWADRFKESSAKAVAIASDGIGEGQFFTLAGGVLSWQDNPFPQNRMACVILDFCHEKTYFEEGWDPKNPTSPTCFALGKGKVKDLEPHEVVREVEQDQAPSCEVCEFNKYGTAEKGQGKACSDRRRLAVIPAGSIDRDDYFELIENPEHYRDAVIGYLRVPPTSLKAFGSYVKDLGNVLNRPPWAVVTQVTVTPASEGGFTISFKPINELDDDILDVVYERVEAMEDAETVLFPYQMEFENARDSEEEEEEEPKRRSKKKATKKKAVTKKSAHRSLADEDEVKPKRRRKY